MVSLSPGGLETLLFSRKPNGQYSTVASGATMRGFVQAAGNTLTVRGPKRVSAVVKLLAEHKHEVLAALSPGAADENPQPGILAAVTALQGPGGDRALSRVCHNDHGGSVRNNASSCAVKRSMTAP
jgi:hypothetical protein